jgi:Flp pilus assembly protein protease CpaA
MDGIMESWVPAVVAMAIASVAAVTDVIEYRIRNSLTLSMIVSGMIYWGCMQGWSGFAFSCQGCALGLAVLIVPWLLGLMGASDAKLLAGVGAWLGWKGVAFTFVAACAVAFVYAVILIICRGRFRETLLMLKVIGYRFVALGSHFGRSDIVEECFSGPDRRYRVIPFGAMVPIGMLAAIWVVWKRWF